jgi:glutamate--cysteine ligase
MASDHDNSYVHFVLAQSRAHREAILKLPLSDEVAARYARLAEESLAEQRGIEASETIPFEAYRQLYLAPLRLNE